MVLRSTYEHFRRQILRQDVEGEYKRHSVANSCRILKWLGVLSIFMSIASFITFANINSFYVAYSENVDQMITLRKGTYNLYIEIEELYQNNLQYTKSISYDQLAGDTRNLNLSETAPYDYNGEKAYYPAGLIADSYFQDRISIEGIEIQENDITWDEERELIGITNYTPEIISIPEKWLPNTNEGSKPLNMNEVVDGMPILNERFVNWIYLSGFSKFRKLWGRMDVPETAEYVLRVESAFDLSKKKLYFTETSWLGYKNYYLTVCLLVLGVLMLMVPAILNSLYSRFGIIPQD